VSHEVINRCYQEAGQYGAVVPVIPVVETVRQLIEEDDSACRRAIVNSGSVTVPRDAYRLVQTPQTFSASLLRRAYEQPYCDAFTDDASVVEALGHAVHLVEGNRENIKLTTPFDLTVACALVRAD
jgi:2-C-methyl-D-erythritol 4-phosphate cytidylyltransferase